ncbi:MAG: helix-turn-helix transcriptional regulator [Actinomycetota bacterium]|nr:helix-turn-helix transcriptional regulator [Actinomycetota bacterium]
MRGQRERGELTETETQVVRLLARGWDAAQIGVIRERSVHTIKTEIQTIIIKLRARNRTHAVAIWLTQQYAEMERLNKVKHPVRRPGELLVLELDRPPADELLALGKDPA